MLFRNPFPKTQTISFMTRSVQQDDDKVFSEKSIDKDAFSRNVLNGLGRDLQLPQSVALTQLRKHMDEVFQMWSDGFSVEAATKHVCDVVRKDAKDDPELSWLIKEEEVKPILTIKKPVQKKAPAKASPRATKPANSQNTKPSSPTVIDGWKVSVAAGTAEHDNGIVLNFAGNPNTDDFSVKPTNQPKDITAIESVGLIREGVNAYTEAFNNTSKRKSPDEPAIKYELEEGQTQGTVKWFSDKKGFGFICADEYEGDIFVHHKDIVGKGFRKLLVGQQVSFVAIDGDRGVQASEVKILS